MAEPDAGSPEWWVTRLEAKLQRRRARFDRLDRYYGGDHDLPEGDERARDAFKRFQRKARTNYCGLIADSHVERLEIVGFRTGGSSSSEFDTAAWDRWQASDMDCTSALALALAVRLSEAYLIAGPTAITAEDPRQVVAEFDPVDRRKPRAALKTWVDDLERRQHAVLYLPNGIYYFAAEDPEPAPEIRPAPPGLVRPAAWVQSADPIANPLEEVPVVRLVPRPVSLNGDGLGAFEDVLDIQDRINDTVLNRLVITKMQAYRQRWAKGIATEDEDGNDLELPFVPGVDLLWVVEDSEGVEFGDFDQSDLDPVLNAITEDVKALVMITGLPPHYVQGDLVNASADAISAAESRLVSRNRSMQRFLSDPFEQAMRLSMAWDGEDLATDAELVWRDPERKSAAQIADAGTKAVTAGVPWRQRMQDMGYTPQEVTRMEADRASDMALAEAFPVAAMTPSPTPPAVPGAGG